MKLKLHCFQQINIILKGQLGYCYRRQGSDLNETVIQKVSINYSLQRPFHIARNVLNKSQDIYFDLKAIKYSYSIKLTTDIFLSILKQNQIDYHYYLMSLDIHQAESALALDRCQYCKQNFHTKFQCQKLHFVPLKSLVIIKHNHIQLGSRDQQRIRSRRNKAFRTIHPYVFKQVFNGHNNMRQSQVKFHKSAAIDYLKLAMMSFGEKKTYQNTTNRAAQNVFKSMKNVDIFDSDISMNLIEVDEIYDFHHYLTPENPSKLLNTPLNIKNQPKRGGSGLSAF